MRALIETSAEASQVAPDEPHAVSHRVIADHLRASAFLIADGVLPSKEGRGYVLRRIMRRAMRHAQILGCKEPLMWRLVPALVQQMGAAFPELLRAQPLITETLRLEEEGFKQTLGRGLALLEEMAEGKGLKDKKTLDGSVAFVLYDTYGFPLDLTQDILRPRGIEVDLGKFDEEMEAARARSRASWAGSGEAATEATWFALREELGATEFLGYETETAEGVILAILKGEERVAEAKAGDEVGVIVAIEAEVNDRIRHNEAVRTRLLSPDRAVEEGALALFGEKYGEEVRVVSMGGALDDADRPYSVELCGGTHVRRTGDIGLFKIVGESSIASGVRRIEALTGAAAEAYLAEEEELLRQSAAALRTSPTELPSRLQRLIEDNRRLERELAEARRVLAGGAGQTAATPAGKRIGDIAFDGRVVDDVPGRELRSLADDLKKRIGSGVVTVVSRAEGKAAIVVGVTQDLTDRVDAVELVRFGAEALGGTGGGGARRCGTGAVTADRCPAGGRSGLALRVRQKPNDSPKNCAVPTA